MDETQGGGMSFLRIRGGHKLKGEIPISGAKNAALPLMCASLLTPAPLTLTNMPDLADIKTLNLLLSHHGVAIEKKPENDHASTYLYQGHDIKSFEAPYDLVRRMRATILVLGPLLARFGQARVSLPGGCAIGARPVDLHIKAMEQLGATIELEEGYIVATAPRGGLIGAEITFPFVSVGATENALMAAVLAKGPTRLLNAACEPEITDLATCLTKMGAKISGIGTTVLEIDGVTELHATTHHVISDRIEAGSFAMAIAATRGSATLTGISPTILGSVLETLEHAGVLVERQENSIHISCDTLTGIDVMTEPYPGFPTDLQAQIMALMTKSTGASMITEAIFENRFMHVPELTRMGANINLHGRSAMVRGMSKLNGAQVMATDLRASLSLVISALQAEGETVISRIYHLERGYSHLVEKLSNCGADIAKILPTPEAS